MSIGIVQPYLFPYIGYFQLISEVDTFVFYDDVNFITQGWINRNKVLVNGKANYFTIPCKDASQNKFINEVKHAMTDKKRGKLLRKIKFSYSNAPFFDDVFTIVENVLHTESSYIADLAMQSIRQTCSYLNLDTTFKISSEEYRNTDLGKAERLIDICKQEKITTYINPTGGKELYSKAEFQKEGITLQFIEPSLKEYQQFDNDFVPGLSIIDVMMFNSPEKIRNDHLTAYNLV
ncbi:WbqC family protein [Fodinibius sp. AD559]|uniref:WbqC family protein n=1 Tax=Fodinibius sp. AD559 TaxID=3424179 RepID=UPI00404702DF